MLSLPRCLSAARFVSFLLFCSLCLWPIAPLFAAPNSKEAPSAQKPPDKAKKSAPTKAASTARSTLPPLPPREKFDLARLSATQKDAFERIVDDEFCGCDSPLTLATCLKERQSCKLATDLGVILQRALSLGMPQQNAQSMLSQHVLGPFCSLPAEIDTHNAPSIGASNAPLELVEFFDYRCTHCKAAQPAIHKALETYGARVRLVSMPIALDEKSVSSAAAEAALAAAAQNKFGAMHRALFAREAQDFTPEVLHELAVKAGLDAKRFDADLSAHTFAPQIKAFMKQFLALGLDGTPAFFLNGRRFEFEQTLLPIEERLQMELDRTLGNCQ